MHFTKLQPIIYIYIPENAINMKVLTKIHSYSNMVYTHVLGSLVSRPWLGFTGNMVTIYETLVCINGTSTFSSVRWSPTAKLHTDVHRGEVVMATQTAGWAAERLEREVDTRWRGRHRGGHSSVVASSHSRQRSCERNEPSRAS